MIFFLLFFFFFFFFFCSQLNFFSANLQFVFVLIFDIHVHTGMQ